MSRKDLTNNQKDEILMKAAVEIDPDLQYEIRNGTLGTTLYVYVLTKEQSRTIRNKIPHKFGGLITIVICTEKQGSRI